MFAADKPVGFLSFDIVQPEDFLLFEIVQSAIRLLPLPTVEPSVHLPFRAYTGRFPARCTVIYYDPVMYHDPEESAGRDRRAWHERARTTAAPCSRNEKRSFRRDTGVHMFHVSDRQSHRLCAYHAHIMYLSCTCHVHIMYLSCTDHRRLMVYIFQSRYSICSRPCLIY